MKSIIVLMIAACACIGTTCQGTGPAGVEVPGSTDVIPLGSPVITADQPGTLTTYSYIQTGIGPNDIRAEGTMQSQTTPYTHASLGSGFSTTLSVTADRYDGFTQLDPIVSVSTYSYVVDESTTRLVNTNLNGKSDAVGDPPEGVAIPLMGGATIEVGQSYSYTYKVGAGASAIVGDTYTFTSSVVETARVTVPYGTVETYRIVGTTACDSWSGTSYSGVYVQWFHPQLGMVRYEGDTTYKRSFFEGGTSTEHIVSDLVSSNATVEP